MSAWDQFSTGGDYAEFNNVGDSVTGTIKSIGAKTWDDGKVSPQLQLVQDDGEEITLTAGWVMLVKALKELAPNVGDRIKVTMTGKGPKPKETRSWSVEALGAAAAPTIAATAAASPVTPVAVPAAAPAADPFAGLTPEQRALLTGTVTPAAPAEDPRVASWRAAGISEAQIAILLAAAA